MSVSDQRRDSKTKIMTKFTHEALCTRNLSGLSNILQADSHSENNPFKVINFYENQLYCTTRRKHLVEAVSSDVCETKHPIRQ